MITPSYAPTATERQLPALGFDFTTGVLDSRIVVTRALNTATRINASGLIETVNADLPRFDYDPVTLAPKGLLVEETRANLFTRSDAFDSGAWVAGAGATVVANNAVSPDGTTNADTYIPTVSGSTSTLQQILTKAASAITYTVSFYTKTAGLTALRAFIYGATTADRGEATFNASTGAVSAVSSSGTFTNTSATATAAGNGWYRCTITTTTDTATAVAFTFRFDGTVDGVSGFRLYGAQFEVGSFATSYIPTTTTSLTRNADNALVTGTNFSSWYNQSQGTFVYTGSRFDNTANFAAAWGVSDGTGSNEMYITRSGTTPRAYTRASGGANGDLNGAQSWALNTVGKIAFAYKTDDMAFVYNANAAITDTSATVPVVNQLQLGRRAVSGGTNYWNGHIKTLYYYNLRLPVANLQALTSG